MNTPKPDSHPQFFLSLIRDTLPHSYNSATQPLSHCSNGSHCALWLQTGATEINDTPITTGHGMNFTATDTIVNTSAESAVILRFIVSIKPIDVLEVSANAKVISETLFTQAINVASATMIMRLDQVDFPPTAIAYKHTHPGPGIRYLVEGGLTLVSDHEEHIVNAGDAWFEDANSAVEATAINTIPSRFVRMMLLPLEYEDRPTFTLHNISDADRPKLQTNIRHFEKRIVIGNTH